MESSNAGVVRWEPSIPRSTRSCKLTKDAVNSGYSDPSGELPTKGSSNIGDIMGVSWGSPLKAL